MKLQQLEDFVAVAQYGGIRAAARARKVSQAGLTLSLQRLEQQYGVTLFERRTHGIALTPQGEQAIKHARSALRECERTERALRGMGAETKRSIRIGVSLDPSITMAATVLGDFQHRYPEVELHVVAGPSDTILPALREGRIELAVARIPGSADSTGLALTPLYRAWPAIVCRPQHPLAAVRSPAELVRCDWVVLAEAASTATRQHGEAEHDAFFREHGFPPPRAVLVCGSLFDAVSALRQGDRLARLPRSILSNWAGAGSLRALDLECPLPAETIALLHRLDQPLGEEARTLAAMLSSYSRINHSLERAVAETAS